MRSSPPKLILMLETAISMTTAEAAELAHCSIKGIQAACERGKLKASKVGRDWHIERRDFDRWLASPRKRGAPRKEKRE